MGEPQIRSAPARGEFDGYDRFGPFGSGCPGQPYHLDDPLIREDGISIQFYVDILVGFTSLN